VLVNLNQGQVDFSDLEPEADAVHTDDFLAGMIIVENYKLSVTERYLICSAIAPFYPSLARFERRSLKTSFVSDLGSHVHHPPSEQKAKPNWWPCNKPLHET
jgi:hypothetical protein